MFLTTHLCLSNPPSRNDIRRILSKRDYAMLCKDFLIVLDSMAGNNNDYVLLPDVIEQMTLRAYNLEFVIPVLLDDYLLPNHLVEQNSNRVRITPHGRKILEQITKPEVLLDDIMDIIESKSNKTEGLGEIVATIKEITFELQDIYRPRIFFDITIGNKINLLDVVLRNSGRSPAYGISCDFEPDLPYYNNIKLSSLGVFKNLPFLEPNREIKFFYNSLFSVIEDKTLPKKTIVRISYSDSKKNQYIETYTVDLERYKGILLSDFTDITDIHKDLENIKKQLDSIQRTGIIVKNKEEVKQGKIFKKSPKHS
jgi:hypothetical protein